MKSECSNGLTRLFGVAASHKRLQVTDSANFDVDAVADQNDEGNWWWRKWWYQELADDDDDEDKEDDEDHEDDEDAEDENEDENEDDDYDEQGCCRVKLSIGSSKRKPSNAVIVSRQVL